MSEQCAIGIFIWALLLGPIAVVMVVSTYNEIKYGSGMHPSE